LYLIYKTPLPILCNFAKQGGAAKNQLKIACGATGRVQLAKKKVIYNSDTENGLLVAAITAFFSQPLPEFV
jgi:hypothetical protein